MFSPLAQGLLTDRYLGGIPGGSRAAKRHGFLKPGQVTEAKPSEILALNLLAQERGQSLAQLALAWNLRHTGVTCVLVGASRVSQTEDNVGAPHTLAFSAEELMRKELLVNEAVDVLQVDPDWTGGVTELVKVCALASAFEVPVIAHGHSLLAALHVAGAQSPATVPYVEYLIRHQVAKQFFHTPVYRPENGEIRLPELPGLGLGLDRDKIDGRQELEF